uniref:THD domain-containing protein n=1 Tax=Arion vulgaris TaxID=1028688 RepID=A0A0B7BB39_9EUPU
MPSKKQILFFSQKHQVTINLVISLAVIVVCIICTALIGFKKGTMKQSQSAVPQHQWCMPCQSLTNGPSHFLMEKLTKSVLQGKEMCCANNSEKASAIMELLMLATDEKEPLKTLTAGDFSLSAASAHKGLTLSMPKSRYGSTLLEEKRKLEFKTTEEPLTEHASNVEIQKYVMVVLKSGMYFIYSNIFINPDTSMPCSSFTNQTWEHNIFLTRNNDKVHSGIIFNTTYTCCDNCERNKETSYTGGMHELQVNDRLHVEVSNNEQVIFSDESSYLGIFMIS